LVVINTTPLAARLPYIAAPAASLAMSMLSISFGLILAKAFAAALVPPTSPVKVGTPSITIKGYELREIELVPRMRNTGGLFTTPFGIVI